MINSTDDYDIIKESLYGDKEAYSILVDRYKDVIFRFAFRMTSNHHEAEDITMDTFVQAYKKLGTFKFGFRFKSWIYAIAANIARDRLRKRKILKILPLAPYRENETGSITDNIADRSAGPDKTLENREMADNIKKLIHTLPARLREVFLLRYMDDLTYDEIVQVSGLPLGTVENRLFRGRKLLMKNRELLDKLS